MSLHLFLCLECLCFLMYLRAFKGNNYQHVEKIVIFNNGWFDPSVLIKNIPYMNALKCRTFGIRAYANP